MINVDPTIKTETKNLAAVVLILSLLMESVYLIIGRWNYTVLLGNILGASAGLLNFFLLGVGIQSALNKDQGGARKTVAFSQTYRTLFLLVILVIAVFVDAFAILPTILSLFFSSFGIYIRYYFLKKNGNIETPDTQDLEETNEEEGDEE